MTRQIAFILLSFLSLLGTRPGYAATFGDVLPGARAAAMGTAYTAIADDPYGMFYNPAGLARSDFTQFSGTVGRMISSSGLVSYTAGAYTRPFPVLPGSTVGVGYFNGSQSGTGAERTDVVFHFSHSKRFPQYYINRPLKFGVNLKVRQAVPGREKRASKGGLGLDGGILYDSGRNWKAGLSVMNLESGVGLPTPSLNLGFAYRWKKRVTFASDMQIRSGLAEIKVGFEMDVYQRLLKLRVGKGLSFDTEKQVSFGLGINYSPVTIDININVPIKGLNHPAGGYQLTFNYKFGAPPFYGRFVGSAAREAEDLTGAILELEEKKKTLDKQVEAGNVDKTALRGQIQSRESRVRELEDKIRTLEYEYELKKYNQGHPPPPKLKKPAPKKVKRRPVKKKAGRIRVPRRHRVLPGDTLRKLAEKYYLDPTLWEIIYEANPYKIERGLPIEGAVLRIPVPERP